MSPPAGVVDGLLAGRYRLVAPVGSGAHGEVWRARDERLARDVAVKVLRPELVDDAEVRARFRAEAHAAGRLRHPGIAAVFDFAEEDDSAWLVMELVQGRPLSDVLRAEGRLPVERVLDVVAQAAAALQAAHEAGVVHRDVKPGNLLLRDDGRLSVTDFGIAQATGAAALTRTGQVVGTAAYLSPEQASGQPVTAAADLYALGVVAHECLSGARPFERDDAVAVLLAHLQAPPPPLPPDVPEGVGDLVHRLLAKDPADRPLTARQVEREAVALQRATQSPPPPTTPLPSSDRPLPLALAARPGQRRAVRTTAVVLGLLALALGVRDATREAPEAPARGVQETGPAATPPVTAPASVPTPAVQTSAVPAAAPRDEPVQAPVPTPVQEQVQAPAQEQVQPPATAAPPAAQTAGEARPGQRRGQDETRGRSPDQRPTGPQRGQQQRPPEAGRSGRG